MILNDVIRLCWDAETSQDPKWRGDNPSRGQCAITACLLHEMLDLEVTRGKAFLPNGSMESHYWNGDLDLTRDQFPEGTEFRAAEGPQGEEAYAYALSNPQTHHRLNILRDRVQAKMSELAICHENMRGHQRRAPRPGY